MAQFTGKTAMVVDDFPTARRFIRTTLEELEFTCIEASSAAQALDLLGTEVPDVILSDLNMPEMNGMELLRELRGRDGFQEVPIVLTMMHETEEILAEAENENSPMSGHLVKPFDAFTLSKVLDPLLK